MAKITTISVTSRTALALVACLFACATLAQDDPHWSKDECGTCHVTSSPSVGGVGLKHAIAEDGCEECHGDRGDSIPCRHRSNLATGGMVIPDFYKRSLRDGRVVCTTCHELKIQCENPRVAASLQNPAFLRNRVSRRSADQCFECHAREGYAELNPHGSAFGTPARPTCMLCHTSIPETGPTGELVVNFNMAHDLNDACRGCHNVRVHPVSMSFGPAKAADEWTHLVVPSAKVTNRMREVQAETGIGLPLDPYTGDVNCATCHNPHDFKIGGEHGSEERAIKHRLRLRDICQACHEK